MTLTKLLLICGFKKYTVEFLQILSCFIILHISKLQFIIPDAIFQKKIDDQVLQTVILALCFACCR